ncbi:MAG: CD1871A family CXXC motif-containing protein [Anaerolineae bacterium]
MSRRFWIFLGLSILMMVAGLLLGEARFVLANATLICLSCIGIQ